MDSLLDRISSFLTTPRQAKNIGRSQPINWSTAAADAQRFIESPKSFALPKINPVLDRGTAINTPFGEIRPLSMARDVANVPFSFAANTLSDMGQNFGRVASGREFAKYDDLKSPASRFGYNLASLSPAAPTDLGTRNTPQQIIGNVAGTIEGPLSVWGGGKLLGLGTNALGQAGNRTFRQALVQNAKTGTTLGGLYGLFHGLAEGRGEELVDQLLQGAGEGIMGAVGGGLFGGILGAGGHTIGSVKNKLVNVLTQKHGMTPEQANTVVKQYARDTAGKFTGLKQTPKQIKDEGLDRLRTALGKGADEPVYYSDLDEALGILDLDPQSGAIDFSEFVPKAKPKIAEIKSTNKATNATDYVKQQTAKQHAARGEASVMDKLRGLRGDVKRKFVDETSAIEDILNSAEKQSKFRLLPTKDIRYQIDKAIRADTLASQFVKDQGLDKVIKNVPDLDAFNQYLIAKQSLRVGQKGLKTGRDANMDQQLIRELESTYEPFARQIKQYNDALLDYKVEAGFVTPELAAALRREYPDYVPLNRVFSELEEQAARTATGRGGPASVGTQNVLKRLRGSEREIVNPLESIMEATATAFREGERNKAAQMLVSYEKLPGNPFNLRRLSPSEATANKHTVSAFINGQKVTYETLPEVAEAARNLNPQQFGLLGQLFAVPTRVLRLGAVGVNVPFVLSNLVRDQIFSSVVSQKAMKTSLANPLNFGRALYHAIGHGKLYDDWIRSGSSFTQFDIGRNQTAPTIAKIRAGRSVGSQIAYTAKNPGQLLRALEDIIGRSEEVTRLQQYGGTRDALLKQGRTAADADLLAGAASRYNTANFGRKGSWAKVVNGVIPFFSAGIAGARSFVRAASQNPVGTGVRFSATIGIPVATATAWNMADPARREAYADIPDYEKENNLILLPENPQRDENGNWNAIKIPVTPGLSNLMSIVRRQVEGMNGVDNGSAAQILAQTIGDVTAATTSLNVGDPRQLVSTFTPQALKPGIEGVLNKNLFTGQDIVSPYMKNLPPEEQVRPNTSGTARLVGRALNVSPLHVENAAGTAFAGTGRQLLNLSDRVLASTGAIPEEQVGGRSVGDDLRGRFTVARGGEKANQLYEELERQKGVNQSRNNKIREAFLSGDSQTLNELTQGMTKQQLSSVLSSANERELRDSLTPEQRAIQSYSKAQREELKASRPDLLPDILAVEQAEMGVGGTGMLIGDYYRTSEGELIDLNFTIEPPKLTGNTELDKKKVSSYKSKLTAKANDIVKLHEEGALTADEAETLLASLEAQRDTVSGGSGGRKGATKAQIAAAIGKIRTAASDAQPGQSKRGSTRVTERSLGTAPRPRPNAGSALVNSARVASKTDIDELIRRYSGR